MFDLKPKTLYSWYRKGLSDYEQDKKEGRWNDKKIDVVDQETGEIKKQRTVYIVAP